MISQTQIRQYYRSSPKARPHSSPNPAVRFYDIESTLRNHLEGDKKKHTGSIKGFEPEERDDDETLEWLDEPATVIRGESGFVAANEVNLNDPDLLEMLATLPPSSRAGNSQRPRTDVQEDSELVNVNEPAEDGKTLWQFNWDV